MKGNLEHGCASATTDEEIIRMWWAKWPDAHIGMATGAGSGVWVLDEDPRHGGDNSRHGLEQDYGKLPNTRQSVTGSKGSHRFFLHPGLKVKNEIAIAPGLDIRGDGGLVILPPSGHISGNTYQWDGLDGVKAPIANAPGWLLGMVSEAPGARKPPQQIPQIVPDGTKHKTCVSLAGSMRRRGCNADEIYAALLKLSERFESPVPEKNLRDIAADIEGRYSTSFEECSTEPPEVLPPGPLPDDPGPESAEPTAARVVHRSQATKLLALLSDLELFHSPAGRPFVTFFVSGHYETHPARSKWFRLYLQQRYYDEIGHALSSKSLQDALGVLEASAIFHARERPVYCRVGEADGNIYLDLGNASWDAIEIRAGGGWSIVPRPPVKFRRARGVMPIPYPKQGSQAASLLRDFLNTNPDSKDLELILAWMLAALRPKGPYPVLVFNCQQGSGKTTLSKVLRYLIDPNEAPMRSQSKEERDLMIAASNSWIIALDNLSHLPDWLSDAICRVSTGGSFATRELFTDEDEILFNVQRPVILNGIEEIATRGDLVDRSLIIELPKIPDDKRRTENEFWAAFEAARPAILGGLLDIVSDALLRLKDVKLPSAPRMADFAEWIVAAEPALGWEEGAFLSAYQANRKEANDVTVDASPIGRYLVSLGTWSGTAAELLDRLTALSKEQERKSKSWPQSPRGLSNAVRRLLPSLRQAGIEVLFDRQPSGNRERIMTFHVLPPPEGG
jgi:hypothetical protein